VFGGVESSPYRKVSQRVNPGKSLHEGCDRLMPTLTLDLIKHRQAWSFPPVCVVCGGAAWEWPEQRFYYRPKRLLLLLLMGIFGFAIWLLLAIILQKSCVLRLPICEEHQSYWRIRKFINCLLVWSAIGCAISFVTGPSLLMWLDPKIMPDIKFGLVVMSALGVVFSLLIRAVYNSMSICVKFMTFDSITLQNVHQSLSNELAAHQEQSGCDLQTGSPTEEDSD
jgi:hypothetical protein